jgi:hypothetical protein
MGWRLVRLDKTQLLVPLLLLGQMQLRRTDRTETRSLYQFGTERSGLTYCTLGLAVISGGFPRTRQWVVISDS